MLKGKQIRYIFFVFFAAILVLSLGNSYPKESKYNTKRLHLLTKSIQEHLKVIKLAKDTIQAGKCPEIKNLDSLLAEEERVYKAIEGWVTDKALSKIRHKNKIVNLKYLTLQGKVIKKEVLSLRLKTPQESFALFRQGMDELEKSLRVYEYELRVFRKRLASCQRRFNVCYEALENNYTKARTREIKDLIRILSLNTQANIDNKASIERTLKVYEQNISNDKSPDMLCSDYFIYFEKALIAQLQYQLSDNQDIDACSDAHRNWSWVSHYNQQINRTSATDQFALRDKACELNHLIRNSKKWGYGIRISEPWVESMKNLTKSCARHIRLCPCDGDTLTIVKPGPVLVRDPDCTGCKDSLAVNYCGYARYRGSCTYAVCPDSCFNEAYVKRIYPQYDPKKDKIIYNQDMCKTSICGCTDPFCTNYDQKYEKDDGSCDCGCLDSTAVNYAWRVSPAWAKEKYYNPNVKNHNPDKCHWVGCMDPCSANYDPMAKISSDSCSCTPVTREELIARRNLLMIQIKDNAGAAEAMEKDFRAGMKNADRDAKKVADQFTFKRENDNLKVIGDIGLEKLKGSGYASQIGLGLYHYPAIYTVCDSLIDFLYRRTGDILFKQLETRIVGEADGTTIRPSGILFNNNGVSLTNQGFKVFLGTDNTNLETISRDNFPIQPTKQYSLNHGSYIYEREHIILAFARAALVKQRLLDSAPAIPQDKILIGAKHNHQIGGDYRKISVVFIVEDFFKVSLMNDYDLINESALVEAAIIFYDKEGYPAPDKFYTKCPCLDEPKE